MQNRNNVFPADGCPQHDTAAVTSIWHSRGAHPGGGGAAAGLGQQPARSLVLVILRFQLHGSQPDLLAVGVSLTQRERPKEAGWVFIGHRPSENLDSESWLVSGNKRWYAVYSSGSLIWRFVYNSCMFGVLSAMSMVWPSIHWINSFCCFFTPSCEGIKMTLNSIYLSTYTWNEYSVMMHYMFQKRP